jgi:hypothetical protein
MLLKNEKDRMMKKIIIISVFLFYSSFSIAQIAGYMGRRFIVGYSANVSPAVLSPLVNTSMSGNTEANREFLNVAGLNVTHGVNIDYVIKRGTSFCVSGLMMKTGLTYKEDYEIPNYLTSIYGSSDIRYRSSDDRPIQLNVTSLTAGLRFSRGAVAPLGKYVKLDIAYFRQRVSFDPEAFKQTGSYKKEYVQLTDQYTFNTVGFGFSFGRQRVFFDRLLVDWGTRIGIIPGAFFRVAGMTGFFDEFSSGTWSNGLDDQMKEKAIYRLQGSQLLNFHIGIGFLAF